MKKNISCFNVKGFNRGFTLLELIIIIVIIGIIAATAAAKWPDESINLTAQTDQIVQDIRYTQSMSMSSGQRHRIYFYSNTYQITDQAGTPVAHPATGTTNPVQLASKISITANNFNGTYLAFNNMGSPFSGTTALTASQSVTLSSGNINSRITVQPNTGAVRLE